MTTEPNYKQMARDMIHYAMMYHPLPWRIEEDWTSEVTAADGTIVCKSAGTYAQAIIDEAERMDQESKAFEKEFELELTLDDDNQASKLFK